MPIRYIDDDDAEFVGLLMLEPGRRSLNEILLGRVAADTLAADDGTGCPLVATLEVVETEDEIVLGSVREPDVGRALAAALAAAGDGQLEVIVDGVSLEAPEMRVILNPQSLVRFIRHAPLMVAEAPEA